MEVLIEDPDLAKAWPDERKMKQRYGLIGAKRLRVRMMQLEAAQTLAEMRGLGRCHELTGNLDC